MPDSPPRYHTDTSDMLIPHGLFRAVLRRPADIIDAHTAAADAGGVAAVHSYYDNVLRFLDAHHGSEDAIMWPVLTERCVEAGDLIRRMESQHGRIHELRNSSGQALEAWRASPTPNNAAATGEALAALRDELERHFEQEEAEILPLASANMSPEEWGALPGHSIAAFNGDKIWLILGLTFEQMNAEQLSFAMSVLPPPVLEMWRTSGRAAFDDFVSRVRTAAAHIR